MVTIRMNDEGQVDEGTIRKTAQFYGLGGFVGAGVEGGHQEQIYGRNCRVQYCISHYENGSIYTVSYDWPSFCIESGETYIKRVVINN